MAGAQSQTIYDANRLVGSELNGTARFVGMGGAMGALGGDISTMSTNPAGIGIYRSSDFMTSFGFNKTNAETTLSGSTSNIGRTKMSYDNIGFVYANKVGNRTALRYVNFGFNYHKSKNFNRSMLMDGFLDGSLTDQMAMMSTRDISSGFPDGIIPGNELLASDAFFNKDVPWLGALGYEANLFYPRTAEDGYSEYAGYLIDEKPSIHGRYKSQESGGINAYNFNLSFNINDRFYIGGTLGAYDVDYKIDSWYDETFYVGNDIEDHGWYSLHNSFRTTGAGVDFKLGFIARPFGESPLRIGMAFHTPTFYFLTDRNFAEIFYDTWDHDKGEYEQGEAFVQDNRGDEMEGQTDYRLVTPWKFNASLGYTIGSSIALGAEYEFMDNSSSKLKYDNNGFVEDMEYENADMKSMLKGTHTIRLGLEAKLVPQFSVRAGYNHTTAAFKSNAVKLMNNNTIRTDAEYSNNKALNSITLGMGYRGSMFYTDLAYQYSFYKSDFYPYGGGYVSHPAAKVNNDRHQLLMTLGMRF